MRLCSYSFWINQTTFRKLFPKSTYHIRNLNHGYSLRGDESMFRVRRFKRNIRWEYTRTLFVSASVLKYMIKWISAYGGCLGSWRRWRTLKSAISSGELTNKRYIPRFPNGETRPFGVICAWIHRALKLTQGTESSKFLEEKKSTEIPLVAASEKGLALKLFMF